MTRDEATKKYAEKNFNSLNRIAGELVLGGELGTLDREWLIPALFIRGEAPVTEWNPMENLAHAHMLRDAWLRAWKPPSPRVCQMTVMGPDGVSDHIRYDVSFLGESCGAWNATIADTEPAAITLACILASLPKET